MFVGYVQGWCVHVGFEVDPEKLLLLRTEVPEEQP